MSNDVNETIAATKPKGRGGYRAKAGRPKGSGKANNLTQAFTVIKQTGVQAVERELIEAPGEQEQIEGSIPASMWLTTQLTPEAYAFVKSQPESYIMDMVAAHMRLAAHAPQTGETGRSSNTPLDSGEAVRGAEEGENIAEAGFVAGDGGWEDDGQTEAIEDPTEDDFEARTRLAPCMPDLRARPESPTVDACAECGGGGYVMGAGGLQVCECQAERGETLEGDESDLMDGMDMIDPTIERATSTMLSQ
jgi:hypothetical protein